MYVALLSIFSVASSGSVLDYFVIQVDRESRSIVFQDPPTNEERSFMSLVKIHGYFISTLPGDRGVMAMKSVISFVRDSLKLCFCHGSEKIDDETVADASLRWLDSLESNHLTTSQWQQIEAVLLDGTSFTAIDNSLNPPSDLSLAASFSDRTKRPRRQELEQELQRVQKQIKRNHDYDVRRGKGQAVKNMNAKLYTPLIRSRAMEYSSIDTGSKLQNDDFKQCIAFEILIKLAEHGGRILDEDNKTFLENSKAVKKVMGALKDKAREMKKKGGDEDITVDTQPIPLFPETASSTSVPRAASMPASALHEEAIEPEAFNGSGASPGEGEALSYFSRYWLRRRDC